MVYVELEEGANFDSIKEAILNDPYFVNDETHATFRQKSGAYTMIEIPVIDYLHGDRDALIKRLV